MNYIEIVDLIDEVDNVQSSNLFTSLGFFRIVKLAYASSIPHNLSKIIDG